jgi:predicted SAM-dependent methyltransferase
MSEVKLNLGCGVDLLSGWINVDNVFDLKDLELGEKTKKGIFKKVKVPKDVVFIRADINNLPFKDNYADFVMLDNVLEHIEIAKVVPVLKEIRRVMKKGATLRIIVPSIDGMIKEYLQITLGTDFHAQKYVDFLLLIMGSQIHEGHYHKCLFNANFLNVVLSSAGFKNGTLFQINKGESVPKEIGSFVRNERDGCVSAYDWLIANIKK